MEKMLTVEMQIAERTRKYRSEALTNLHEFINEPLLQESFDTLNKKGASGVDAAYSLAKSPFTKNTSNPKAPSNPMT